MIQMLLSMVYFGLTKNIKVFNPNIPIYKDTCGCEICEILLPPIPESWTTVKLTDFSVFWEITGNISFTFFPRLIKTTFELSDVLYQESNNLSVSKYD